MASSDQWAQDAGIWKNMGFPTVPHRFPKFFLHKKPNL
jgi:hypothetical protein